MKKIYICEYQNKFHMKEAEQRGEMRSNFAAKTDILKRKPI